MTRYATVHALMHRARLDALTKEARDHYSTALAAATADAEQRNGGRQLTETSLERLRDWTITNVETGGSFAQQVASAGPIDMQQALDDWEIEGKARDLRLREHAARRVKAEQAQAKGPRPTPVSLATLLASPDDEAQYRIGSLLPTGGNCILAAQYKAGKSTLIGNLLRSLVDGAPFLGTFPVRPVNSYVVLIDNELDTRTLRRWLRAQGIENVHKVAVLNLRGKASSFDPREDDNRADWAATLRGAEVVILDCLRPTLDALGLDENLDAGQFLVAWDEFLADVGAQESIVVHHMGHSGERQRGSSRLLDWPDVTWKIMRENDDPSSPRFFSAYGRDVDLAEGSLSYSHDSRHLTYAGGGRKEVKGAYKLPQVLEFLANSPGTSKTGIKQALPGDDKATATAIEQGVAAGLIVERDRPGRGGGKCYFLPETPNPGSRVNPGVPGF
ncbi:AAA family ATPase [Arthrobacter sp. Br18]|uniref:AAA family ATPase n=1 Tax=Arthrobacter sp. Br18 TaxID=1312954 RepID=UPI000478B414|nr:AAA family ATPase [Arthrobacter sp. Br18]